MTVKEIKRKIVFLRVDPALWSQAKSTAALKGVPLQDFVAELLKKAVN